MNTIQVITIDQQGEIQKCQIICYLRIPEYTGKPSPSPHRGRILHRCVRCTTQQYPVDIGNGKKIIVLNTPMLLLFLFENPGFASHWAELLFPSRLVV